MRRIVQPPERPVVAKSKRSCSSGLATLPWLQNFTPDRTPDFTAAFAGAGGAILGAALFELLLRAMRAWRSPSIVQARGAGLPFKEVEFHHLRKFAAKPFVRLIRQHSALYDLVPH